MIFQCGGNNRRGYNILIIGALVSDKIQYLQQMKYMSRELAENIKNKLFKKILFLTIFL